MVCSMHECYAICMCLIIKETFLIISSNSISGDYFAATEHFESFYKLSNGKQDWELQQGGPMYQESCSHLTRIYTTIATNFDLQGDLQSYLSYLEKAYETAKEG